MPTTDGTIRRGTTTMWSAGVLTEGHDQGSSLLERKGNRKNTLLGFARMTRSQLADKALQPQSPISENHTRGHLVNFITGAFYANIDGSRILPLDRAGGGSATPLATQEILVVAEDAERFPGTESRKQHDSRTYDKTHQTARVGRALRGNASIERTRQKTQHARTQVRKLTEQVQLLMTSSQERGAASSAESSAEWQMPAGKQQ